MLQHLLPLSFPVGAAAELLQAGPPALASLASAVVRQLSSPGCKERSLPEEQKLVQPSRGKDGVTDIYESRQSESWGGLIRAALRSTDPEEWLHFLAFASALLEGSIPGGLYPQVIDSCSEGLHTLHQLEQQEEKQGPDSLICRLWLQAVEAAILKGSSMCGGWACLLHCAAAPQDATVSRHFDFAAARAWSLKVDSCLDAGGSADLRQLLHRAYTQQEQKRQHHHQKHQQQQTDSLAASSATAQTPSLGKGNTERQQQQQPQQLQPARIPGRCVCRLCCLSALQLKRVLCLLDPRSISAFGCSSRDHWLASQGAVSGLEILGSDWMHALGRRGLNKQMLGPSSLKGAVPTPMADYKKEARPKRGGLFPHQQHALLWLRHRERRKAPQLSPADIRLSWRPLGCSASAEKAAVQGSTAERVCQGLQGERNGLTSSFTSCTKGHTDTSAQVAWPRRRPNDCRDADDLLKALSTWVELPLPCSSWLSETLAQTRRQVSVYSNARHTDHEVGGGDHSSQKDEQEGLRLLKGPTTCLYVFAEGHPELLFKRLQAGIAAPPEAAATLDAKTAAAHTNTKARSSTAASMVPTIAAAGAAPAADATVAATAAAVAEDLWASAWASVHTQTEFAAQKPGDFSLYVSLDFKTVLLGYAGGALEVEAETESQTVEDPDTECIGGMFCDDPGLGKTLSLLSLAVTSRSRIHRPPRHLWPPPYHCRAAAGVSTSALSASASASAVKRPAEPPLARRTRMRTRQASSLATEKLSET